MHYLAYEDDGPSGPCGQSVSITMPWRKLLVYENPDDAYALMGFLASRTVFGGRRRPRIVGAWSDDDYLGGKVEPGWVVPAEERSPAATGEEG
jgi:hypothetical protein